MVRKAVWPRLPGRSFQSVGHTRQPLEWPGCADLGVSVSACSRPPALIAVVSLITFGVLLNGLSDQSQPGGQGRARSPTASTRRRCSSGSRSSSRTAAQPRRDSARARAAVPARRARKLHRDAEDAAGATAAQARGDRAAGWRRTRRSPTRRAPGPRSATRSRRFAAAKRARAARAARREPAPAQPRDADRRRRARGPAGADRGAGVRARCARSSRRSTGSSASPASSARAASARACRRPARRRRPSSRAPSTPAPRASSASTDRHLAELDAVFRDSPLGIAFLDLDLRFLRVNEALAQMNQVPADEHLGRTVGEVTGQHEIERALREVIAARRAAARGRHRAARAPLRGQLLRRSATTAASCWRSARR